MSSYDEFAQKYSGSMEEEGDYFHNKYIDPAVYELVGGVEDKVIYDIGCGNGYMARHFAKNGARKVFASDVSEELIKIAKGKSEGLNIEYSVRDAADFKDFENDQFDAITMNMVIHYIEDLDKLLKGVFRVLNPDGKFVFSTNHFFRPTWPYSDWTDGMIYGEKKIFIKVNGYLVSKKVEIDSYWHKNKILEIVNRPLNVYVDELGKRGMYIDQVIEPHTPEFPRSTQQELKNDHHIPTFIIFRAAKK